MVHLVPITSHPSPAQFLGDLGSSFSAPFQSILKESSPTPPFLLFFVKTDQNYWCEQCVGHGQSGGHCPGGEGDGDTAGERMKDTNPWRVPDTSISMAQSSAAGAIPHFPRVSGVPSLTEGSGSSAALCPIPRNTPETPVPAVLLSQAPVQLAMEPGTACSSVLCPRNQQGPGAGHSSGGSQAVAVTAGSEGREKQQVLAAPRYHQASREASKTERSSFPTASFEENGTRSLQGCSHLAEAF